MEGWKELSLKDIGWFRGAGVNKLLSPEEQSVYLINYMDVYTHWRIYFSTRYQLVTAKKREIEEANLLVGDILFTPSSEKPIDIGHAGVVMEDMPNCLYSYHLIRYRLFDRNKFDLTYLSYLLNSDEVQKHFVSRASGSGIRYTLSLNDFRSVKIRVPEKAVQIKIANILSKVDEAIESVQNSIVAAERLKKSLMQNLLTGKMKPDGTFRTPEEFYTDEKFGQVPVGWKVKKLKDIASIQRGKFGHRPRNDERFYNGNYSFVQTNDVVESVLYLKRASQSLNELGASVSKCFPRNTIIMTIAANIGYVTLAQYEVYFPDSLIGINANENIINPMYLLFQLMGYKNVLDALATESAQKNINYSNLRPLTILLPTNLEEQLQITKRIIMVFNEIECKKSKILILERLKKSLMQNLLTGKEKIIDKTWQQ